MPSVEEYRQSLNGDTRAMIDRLRLDELRHAGHEILREAAVLAVANGDSALVVAEVPGASSLRASADARPAAPTS